MNEIVDSWTTPQLSKFMRWLFELGIVGPEAGTFYAIAAVSALSLPQEHPLSVTNSPDLSNYLQAQATETLNVALADPSRNLSDAVLFAVLFIMGTISLNGQTELLQTVHLPALNRMVQLRGGLAAIANRDEEGAMLARSLAWGDRTAASMHGYEPCFANFGDPSLDNTDWNSFWPRVQKRSHAMSETEELDARRNRARHMD